MFNKETDLIKRFLNLILIIWLIIAVIISYNSIINLVIDNAKYDYDEYQLLYCGKKIENDDCQESYDNYSISQKKEKRTQTKVLVNSVGNAIIIGVVIIVLNKGKIVLSKENGK